jgi:hypothetical protein
MHTIVSAGDTLAYDPKMDEQAARGGWITDTASLAVVAIGPDGAIVGTANMHSNHEGPGAHVASASCD